MADAKLSQRLRSLDAVRGLVIILMITVNTAAYVHYANEFHAYPLLLHAHWEGFTLADAVFPAFAFMIGVSIAVARRDNADKAERVRHAFWRAFLLILLGLYVSNSYWLVDMETTFRPMGVLQRLAVVSLVASLLVLYAGPRTRLAIAAAILLLYWPLCLIPTPDGVPTNLDVRGQNFVAWFDRLVLGPHRYVTGPEGYDPEGLLSTLPAIAQGLLGVTLGEYVVKRRGETRAILMQALVGAIAIGVGLAWGVVFPVVKDIWTSTFVLVSSGATMIVFAFCQALLDRDASQKPVLILTAFGANAIAAYMFHIVASGFVESDAMKAPYHAAATVLPEHAAALVPVILFVALIWAYVAYMLRRGWFIKL